MQRLFIAIMLLSLSFPAMSQQAIPGGVKAVCLWNTTKTNGSVSTMKTVTSNLTDTLPKINCNLQYSVNNNPAVYINESSFGQSLDLSKLSGYSLFTICQPIDTAKEQVLFYTEGDTGIKTVLTDNRLASLDICQYSNYDSREKKFPRIYSYCHFNNKDTNAVTCKLHLGQTPRKQNLPVHNFKGIVPEIILFGRNLTYRERLRVESYLSLKYGIPLGQQMPTNYLNSSGDTIWDADINSNYSENIAGIGRDDASGLYQPTSECLHDPGMMKISTASEIANNSFVIWGDNKGDARFKENHSLPKCLGKEWRLNSFKTSKQRINISSNPLAIKDIKPLEKGETFWIMIDKSGTGSYPFGKTKFVKSENSILNDTIRFRNIIADQDSSGADVFTMIAMPEFFARCLVDNPKCGIYGKLLVEIAGGKAPFRLILLNNEQNVSREIKTLDTLVEINSISQGGYKIILTDNNNQTYSEEIWVSNGNAQECSIKQSYKIAEGTSISLDASFGMPKAFTYSWLAPSEEMTNSPSITVSKPGIYYLTMTGPDGCNSIMKLNVTNYKIADIEAVEVFPNPTNGNFSVRAELSNIAELTISITEITGKTITSSVLSGHRYYWYNGTIKKPGLYALTFNTINDQKTLKLVVK